MRPCSAPPPPSPPNRSARRTAGTRRRWRHPWPPRPWAVRPSPSRTSWPSCVGRRTWRTSAWSRRPAACARPWRPTVTAWTTAPPLRPDVVVLVADAGLGTINAVRLTLHALGRSGAASAVVVLNRFDDRSDLHRRNLEWLRGREGDGFSPCRQRPAVTMGLIPGSDAELLELVRGEPPAPAGDGRSPPELFRPLTLHGSVRRSSAGRTSATEKGLVAAVLRGPVLLARRLRQRRIGSDHPPELQRPGRALRPRRPAPRSRRPPADAGTDRPGSHDGPTASNSTS